MLNKKTDDVRQPQDLKGYNSELEGQILKTKLQLRNLLGQFARPSRTSCNGMQRLCDVKQISELRRGLDILEGLMGGEMTKPLPPFAMVASPQKHQPNHVFVMCGPGAWELARQYNKRNYPALVCPDNEPPETFQWPVFDRDVTVLDYGFSDDQLEALAYSLIKAGALLVAVVADANGRGQVFTYSKEALANAA